MECAGEGTRDLDGSRNGVAFESEHALLSGHKKVRFADTELKTL